MCVRIRIKHYREPPLLHRILHNCSSCLNFLVFSIVSTAKVLVFYMFESALALMTCHIAHFS